MATVDTGTRKPVKRPKPTAEKLDMRDALSRTAKRYPKIMARLAE